MIAPGARVVQRQPAAYVFTGTRDLPIEWLERLSDLVDTLPTGALAVVGCCVGLDAQVARFAHPRLRVHAVVPGVRGRWLDPHWRAFCWTHEEMPAGSTFRERDERMVRRGVEADGQLIAVPRWPEDDPRSKRSGTWMTVRLARRAGMPVEVQEWWR